MCRRRPWMLIGRLSRYHSAARELSWIDALMRVSSSWSEWSPCPCRQDISPQIVSYVRCYLSVNFLLFCSEVNVGFLLLHACMSSPSSQLPHGSIMHIDLCGSLTWTLLRPARMCMHVDTLGSRTYNKLISILRENYCTVSHFVSFRHSDQCDSEGSIYS
jgi:hypothetical protein